MLQNKFIKTILVFYLLLSFIFILMNWELAIFASLIPITFILTFLINSNKGFNIRNLFLVFYCLQYLIGSSLSYKYDNVSSYKMIIDSNQYYSFAIPGILLFGLGLYFITEKSDEDKIFNLNKSFIQKIDETILINLFVISCLIEFLPFEVPELIKFVIFILKSFKYAFVCYLIVSKEKLKIQFIITPILFLTYHSIASGMFHDLLTWCIFFGISASIRYQIKIIKKIILLLVFIGLVFIIQISKKDYRSATWDSNLNEKNTEKIGIFEGIAKSNIDNLNEIVLVEGIVRINQGWILARAINRVPGQEDFAGFSLINRYFEAAILPRFLASNKIRAGDQKIVYQYTGIYLLDSKTAMAIGLFGDAWASFGYFGGLIYIFCFGLFINYSLKYFENFINKFPLIYYLLPIIYFYPIRPDCETQTWLGHLIKSTFLISLIAYYFMVKIKKVRTSTLNLKV